MAWKKRLPENILMDAQVWMPRGEGTALSGSCPGSSTSPVCRMLLGKETTSSPSSMQEGPAAPWEPGAGSHPAQLALGTGNEQGNFHLQPRKKLHPKTLVSCLVL